MSQLRFNPATGNFESIAPPSLPRYGNNTPSGGGTTRTHRSLNDIVAGIGDAIADFTDRARPVLTQIVTWLLWIAGIAALIYMAVEGHWFLALVIGAIAGYLYVGITALLAVAGVWLLFLPLAALRFIFTNLFTLIISVVVIGGVLIYNNIESSDTGRQAHGIEEVEMPVNYRCTASVLNVRSNPSATAPVIGVLVQGANVQVINYYYMGDFAQIRYNGQLAYVARDYLEVK